MNRGEISTRLNDFQPALAKLDNSGMLSVQVPRLEGWLYRFGRNALGRSFFHKRFFVLHGCALSYYKRKPADDDIPVRTLHLNDNCRVEDLGLETHHGHSVYVLSVYNKKNKSDRMSLSALTVQESQKWKAHIEHIIDEAAETAPSYNGPRLLSSGSVQDLPSVAQQQQADKTMDSLSSLSDSAVAMELSKTPQVTGCGGVIGGLGGGQLLLGKGEAAALSYGGDEDILMGEMARDADGGWRYGGAHGIEEGEQSSPRSGPGGTAEPFSSMWGKSGARFSRKHWRLRGCQNGLRIFEELADAEQTAFMRPLMAVGVVEASCEDVFSLIIGVDEKRYEWDVNFMSGRVVEEVDGHKAIIHYCMPPSFLPGWVSPRDMCFLRYWRRNGDGTYVILKKSTEHTQCPPTPGFVRAHLESGGWIISPLKPRRGFARSCVQHYVQLDVNMWPLGSISGYNRYMAMQSLNSVACIREWFNLREDEAPVIPNEAPTNIISIPKSQSSSLEEASPTSTSLAVSSSGHRDKAHAHADAAAEAGRGGGGGGRRTRRSVGGGGAGAQRGQRGGGQEGGGAERLVMMGPEQKSKPSSQTSDTEGEEEEEEGEGEGEGGGEAYAGSAVGGRSRGFAASVSGGGGVGAAAKAMGGLGAQVGGAVAHILRCSSNGSSSKGGMLLTRRSRSNSFVGFLGSGGGVGGGGGGLGEAMATAAVDNNNKGQQQQGGDDDDHAHTPPPPPPPLRGHTHTASASLVSGRPALVPAPAVAGGDATSPPSTSTSTSPPPTRPLRPALPQMSFPGSFQRGDHANGINCWSICAPSDFRVRSRGYLDNRSKVPSGPHLLELVAVDWFLAAVRMDHLAQCRGSAAHVAAQSGMFSIVVNVQVPATQHYSMVFYFVSPEPIAKGSLLHRFVHGSDRFRNSRFKLIPAVPRGPWLVRQSVGSTPCLLGKALECTYHLTDAWLEIDVDIGSSTVANGVLGLVFGYVTSLAVDMAYLVQSNTRDELPEQLLGAVRVSRMRLDAAVPPPPDHESWNNNNNTTTTTTTTTTAATTTTTSTRMPHTCNGSSTSGTTMHNNSHSWSSKTNNNNNSNNLLNASAKKDV